MMTAIASSRPADSHKGQNGRVLVIGGSYKYTGAPALSAMAVLKVGADISVVVAPSCVSNTIRSFSPNLIVWDYDGRTLNNEAAKLIGNVMDDFDSFLVGPGLAMEERGRSSEGCNSLRDVLRLLEEKSVVADAEALHLLAKEPRLIGKDWVLTPHRGEFGLLVGRKNVMNVREEAKDFAKRNKNCTLVVKGNPDVISDGKRVVENHTGNAAMTVGGTGDVLAGVIAAFLTKKTPFDAARLGAFANGVAGDHAFRKYGVCLLATDVIDSLPRAMIHVGDVCGEPKSK